MRCAAPTVGATSCTGGAVVGGRSMHPGESQPPAPPVPSPSPAPPPAPPAPWWFVSLGDGSVGGWAVGSCGTARRRTARGDAARLPWLELPIGGGVTI